KRDSSRPRSSFKNVKMKEKPVYQAQIHPRHRTPSLTFIRHTHTHTHTHTHSHTTTHSHTHTHPPTHPHTHTHKPPRTCIHTCTHTHTHKVSHYPHTHTLTQQRLKHSYLGIKRLPHWASDTLQ